MNIRLKDTIHPELKSLGLKPGDIINGHLVNEETGLIHLTYYYKSFPVNCSIWPEDYDIVESKTPNNQIIEAAFQAGFEPSDETFQNKDLMFIEAQEFLTNQAIRN